MPWPIRSTRALFDTRSPAEALEVERALAPRSPTLPTASPSASRARSDGPLWSRSEARCHSFPDTLVDAMVWSGCTSARWSLSPARESGATEMARHDLLGPVGPASSTPTTESARPTRCLRQPKAKKTLRRGLLGPRRKGRAHLLKVERLEEAVAAARNTWVNRRGSISTRT